MEAIAGFFGAFFILGSFWFWVLALGFLAGVVALADNEELFWGITITAIFTVGVIYFNNITIVWTTVLWYVLAYLIVGLIMALLKWISYLNVRADKFVELKLQWSKNKLNKVNRDDIESVNFFKNIDKHTNMKDYLDSDMYREFIKFLGNQYFISKMDQKIIPNWNDKIQKLIGYVLWWPAVMLWTLIDDPFRRAIRWIVSRFGGWYDAIAMKVFSNVGVTKEDDEDTWRNY